METVYTLKVNEGAWKALETLAVFYSKQGDTRLAEELAGILEYNHENK